MKGLMQGQAGAERETPSAPITAALIDRMCERMQQYSRGHTLWAVSELALAQVRDMHEFPPLGRVWAEAHPRRRRIALFCEAHWSLLSRAVHWAVLLGQKYQRYEAAP